MADNLRSAFNVGGVFRTVDAAGGEMVHLSGYTARPPHPRVLRSAMGAEALVGWKAWPDARPCLGSLLESGFHLVGLEPTAEAVDYRHYPYELPLCVVIGNEALGIAPAVARRLHGTVRIPMHGCKGSLNVVVALGVVLFRVVELVGRPRSEVVGSSARGALALVRERVRDSCRDGVWAWEPADERGPALILLALAPGMPPFDVWAHADRGGLLLMFRPRIAEGPRMPGAPRWAPLLPDQRNPRDVPPAGLPPASRALAFDVAARIARAASCGGKARLGFDHVVWELLQRGDLPTGFAGPELTRFLDAESPAQMRETAIRCADVLLRPLGGVWRPAELIYDPEDVGRDPKVAAFVRTVIGPDEFPAPAAPIGAPQSAAPDSMFI